MMHKIVKIYIHSILAIDSSVRTTQSPNYA